MDTSTKRKFRDILKAHIKKLRLVKSGVAERAGVKKNNFYEFLRTGKLGTKDCQKIAHTIFNMSMEEVVSGVPTTPQPQPKEEAPDMEKMREMLEQFKQDIYHRIELSEHRVRVLIEEHTHPFPQRSISF